MAYCLLDPEQIMSNMRGTKLYDYLIIGAGPAGLQAAVNLSVVGKSVLIVDKGKDIKNRVCPKQHNKLWDCRCRVCNVLHGLGGAGGKSDGKLLFSPTVGYDLYKLAEPKVVDSCIRKIEKLYIALSGSKPLKEDLTKKRKLELECLQAGLTFKPYHEMHIGSDIMIHTMTRFREELEANGVEFWFETEAKCDNNGIFLIKAGIRHDATYLAKKTVVAVGRSGGNELIEQLVKNRILQATPKPIDIGVRLETLNAITKPVTDIQYDFKIMSRYNDFIVRSYCVNPGGFVVNERHQAGANHYNLTNGHSEAGRKSDNCNFAILFKAELVEPATDSMRFGQDIASIFHGLGKGQPIVQRLQDIYNNRRSTPNRISRSNVVPTLTSAVPGSIAWGMPYDFLVGIIDYIKKLDAIIPGIADGYNTILYAPEIKFQASEIRIDEKFCGNKERNLYVIGDCSGRSGSIVSAAVNGMLFAKQMEDKNDKLHHIKKLR